MNNYQQIVETKADGELLTMLYEFEQWSEGMLLAVEEELTKRNMFPSDVAIRKQALIDEEAKQLESGRPASFAGQLFGWLGVFGIIGLVVGYQHAFAKATSKYTGKKYYKYDLASREVGRYIFYTCISISILQFFYILITTVGNGF